MPSTGPSLRPDDGSSCAVPGADRIRVLLLDGFRLTTGGREVPLPTGSKRLSALLALHTGELTRAAIAGTLWPESAERQAQASLRAALFRIRRCGPQLVEAAPACICLARTATVDFRESVTLAYRLLDADATRSSVERVGDAIPALSSELLPGWYDDWVIRHAEMWRQLRLHALERLANHLVTEHRYAEAAAAASAAVAADPLRESGRAALITVHRAEGNHSEAWREFDLYRALLRGELGIEPTPRLRRLAGDPVSSVTDLLEVRRQARIEQTVERRC